MCVFGKQRHFGTPHPSTHSNITHPSRTVGSPSIAPVKRVVIGFQGQQ